MNKTIKMLIHQHCIPEGNINLKRWEKWLYTFKAILCLILRRFKPDGLGYVQYIVVAVLAEYPLAHWEYGHYIHWETLIVGRGLFSCWWVDFQGDDSI